MLNNIVDNIEQCGQHKIVQGCFHQPRTGCAFFAVYVRAKPHFWCKNVYTNVMKREGMYVRVFNQMSFHFD